MPAAVGVTHDALIRMDPYTDDLILSCVDCTTAFVFTAGEQRFYARQTPPFASPKRCPVCRQRRSQSRHRRETRQPRPSFSPDDHW